VKRDGSTFTLALPVAKQDQLGAHETEA
jgi:hypothetical protein